MDSPYDSDVSEGMRELIEQGFAIKRGRESVSVDLSQAERVRATVRDTDVPNVQRPFALNVPAGVVSTHSLTSVIREVVTAAGRNTGTTEAEFEAVGKPRSITREGFRRSDERGLSNEEMLVAYDELEREMNELKNNIGKRINPNDTGAMSAWRERIRSTEERTMEDIEKRASQLAEAAPRIRDRTYAGARVIEITPVEEASANNYDARSKRADASARAGSNSKKSSAETSQVKLESERKEKIKPEKIVKIKKE